MNVKCPRNGCKNDNSRASTHPISEPIVRNGSYFRKSDSKRIDRFYCRTCAKYFSRATTSRCYRQKRRRLNHPLYELVVSGVSQRRAAMILGTTRRTVVRKFRWLAAEARAEHTAWLKELEKLPLDEVQFDDLETAEHTKCKPLSVAIAVEPGSRKVLSYHVSQMPAKGKLVAVARKKYGPRKDERSKGWESLLHTLKPIIKETAVLISDENPLYKKRVRLHYPKATHVTFKGRRGCIAGQGELKKIHFDPLFSLNHTCAMFRANMNRLFRRTWCLSKNATGLLDHISIYVKFHNQRLTPESDGSGAS